MYVNRTLVEADFVLPVGAPLPGDTALNDGVYPHFSGSEARERFDQRQDSESARQAEVELANDMLGSFFTVQLVCGPGEITHCVVCGERHVALDKARKETNALWQFPFEGSAKAAVATIEASVNQNWLDFAKAVNFAHQFVEPEGPIVVWSAISTKPDRWIKKVCQAQFDNAIDISKLPADYQRLAHALADRPIYLKSELNQSEIEGLGIGYLQNENELVRLTHSFEQPLLIRDAHLCQPLGEQVQSQDRP